VTVPFHAGLLVLLAAGAPQTLVPTGPGPASRPAPVAAATTPRPAFDELWAAHVKAEAAGDTENAQRLLREIGRLQIERNVETLETLGLALVARGAARLGAGQREGAEEAFRSAVGLAPGLPDGHYGLALALLKRGPLGVVPSVRATASGLVAFLSTARGAIQAMDLATVAGLLVALGFAWALALALLVRRGGLLRHDIEEWLGPAHGRSASLALVLLLLLLPTATFQGWGWLPLWWLALLFTYFSITEKAAAILVLLAAVAVGPVVAELDSRLRTARNPLFWAAMATVEGEPDRRSTAVLEAAARADPGDRDLSYLLGNAWRRSGRYDEAMDLYLRMLASDPKDAVARNNLANLEFARGQFEAAIARYRAGTEAGGASELVATSFYNLSLAHLQRFEYQAYNEAKSNADRLARSVVAGYDRWRYDSGDYAVVDLGLSPEQVFEKFAGSAEGVAVRNVLGGARREPPVGMLIAGLRNRFTAFPLVFAAAALAVGRWRGPRAFTLHCSRCGTAFCRRCHLGQAVGGLCSQCYHLFVVRDGVSGPARNRKMLEVQAVDARRVRTFRALSVPLPGAGQVYAGHTVMGVVLLFLWCVPIATTMALGLVPLGEVASRLTPSFWFALAVALVLLAVWGVANRLRPDFGVTLPTRRPGGPRRGRAS
jgi:tetratricopeptide (TPR) repeat protein